MAKKIGLGNNLKNLGLKELLSNIDSNAAAPSQSKPSNDLQKLPIESLCPGKYQPRGTMNDATLQELAESIRAQGIIQPIVVRKKTEGDTEAYEIIAGERRWRAAQLASLDKIPVVIRNDIDDEQSACLALIENVQREDLNVMDVAASLRRLVNEFGLTHEAAAKIIGKSRASITNLLRLLELNEEVKNMLRLGKLEMGHARALLSLDKPKQLQIAKIIVARGFSVRAAENLVNGLQNPGGKNSQAAKIDKDPNILQLQNKLKARLGARVRIKHQISGKGKLIVNYHSIDELEGILDRIGR